MAAMERLIGALVTTIAMTLALAPAQPTHFDVLIRNGRVMDGSGNPWLRADLGIIGDRIVAVGRLGNATAARTIDARDRVVAPGFIDVHSHAAEGVRNPALHQAQPLLAQGVTTIVANPDGGGPVVLGVATAVAALAAWFGPLLTRAGLRWDRLAAPGRTGP